MTENPIRFPVSTWQRMKNRRGKNAVHCMVSGRYFTFGELGPALADGRPVTLNIMTSSDEDSQDRKLCELVVTLEELQQMVATLQAQAKEKP